MEGGMKGGRREGRNLKRIKGKNGISCERLDSVYTDPSNFTIQTSYLIVFNHLTSF